jgi:hypothetical protein
MPGLIARLAEAEAALYPDHEAPYSANVNAHGQGTPLPPDGLRSGQLGVVLLGRVIVGDIAATLVDLAGREIVQVAEDQDAGSGPAQA